MQGAVDGGNGEAPRPLGARLHPRFVELHHINAGLEQLVYFFIDGGGVVKGEVGLVRIIIVLCLLAHGERAGNGGLEQTVAVAAQKHCIANLYGLRAPDRADHAGYLHGLPAAASNGAGLVDINPLQGGGEAIGITLAAHFAVRNDVDTGLLHGPDGEQGSVVLRLFQERLGNAPQLTRSDAWNPAFAQQLLID